MKKTTIGSLVFLLVAWTGGSFVTPAAAQDANSQRFVVPLSDPSQPATLEVGLIQGSIDVEAHEGNEVIVEIATDREDSEITQKDGMFRIPNTSSGLEIEERDNHVEVSTELSNREIRLHILVPQRTSMQLGTVNGGDISVRGITGELELENVNGEISALDVSGSVIASTTNGEITVTFVTMDADKPMSFTTWNGDVDITFPADFSGNLRMNAGRGEILSDFQVDLSPVSPTVERESDGRGYRVVVEQEVKGAVGGGGPDFRFKTYNGSIYLRSRG